MRRNTVEGESGAEAESKAEQPDLKWAVEWLVNWSGQRPCWE